MGTLTEEIFSRRLGRPIHAGEIVVAPVDYAMAHDVTGPLAIEAFRHLEVPLGSGTRDPRLRPYLAGEHRRVRWVAQAGSRFRDGIRRDPCVPGRHLPP